MPTFANDTYYDVGEFSFDLQIVELAGAPALQVLAIADFFIKGAPDPTQYVHTRVAVLDDQGAQVLLLSSNTGGRVEEINVYYTNPGVTLPAGTYTVRVHLEHQGLTGVQAFVMSDPFTVTSSSSDPFDDELTYRLIKNDELTWPEGDENFRILDRRTRQLAALPASKFDIGTGLPILPTDDYSYKIQSPEGAKELAFYDLKKIFAAQGANQSAAQYLSVATYANLVVLEGVGDVLLIDQTLCAPGSDLNFSVLSPGVRFRHMFDKTSIPVPDRPANYDNLVPLHISTKSDYTTINEKEPFTFKLVEYSTGREFSDWARAAKAGGIEQEIFVAVKSQGQGIQVEVGFQIFGFSDGETDTVQRIYGSATFAPNAQKNTLTCTGAGVLTGIKTTFDSISVLAVTAADVAADTAFFFGTSGRTYPCGGGAVTVGVFHSDSAFFEHFQGMVSLPSGALVIHTAAKVAQISL